jgi:hypothetical protein
LKIAAQKAEKLALREKKEADKSEASTVEEKKDAGADAA